MKTIKWNTEKAKALREDESRGNIGFEDCLIAIESERILGNISNPTRSNQMMFILDIGGYAYIVPYVENEKEIFLKTVYPSRKYTALYFKK